ncbi:hypothetical protein [Lacticaseibacillus zhaodongensis]|uniref:hypothetical protein n=1 Tax=Lacticaseibacillus zhaodongensis TaxID=2668065 RepID=UPI0012D2BC34|nr:hypothetical protein [Lacticaseibacillus zhaodongensis]
MKLQMSTLLHRHLEKTGEPRKAIAIDAGLTRSTGNDYIHGANVPGGTAIDIATALNDADLSMSLGHAMLGLLTAFNGDKWEHNSKAALDSYDAHEEMQEKQSYENNDIRTLLSTNELSDSDRRKLKKWLAEKLDSTVMDMTLIANVCQQLGTSPMDLFESRLPLYKKEHYMKEDEPKWHKERA